MNLTTGIAVYGDANAWASQPGGRKHAGAVVAAAEAAAQEAEEFAANSTIGGYPQEENWAIAGQSKLRAEAECTSHKVWYAGIPN